MAKKPKQEFENDLGSGPKSPSPGPKRRKASSGSKPKASRGTKPKQVIAPGASTRPYQPSDDEIRLRAYFIAERRMRLALEGDSTHDWIEARQQLINEAEKKRP